VHSKRSPLDLVGTIALALAGLGLALLGGPSWARVALLLPLVFCLPGYAVVCALLPADTIPPVERAVYTVALSIAICALGAVLLQLVLRLDRTVWAAMLTLVTLAASAVALRRRRPLAWRSPMRSAVALVSPASSIAILLAVAIATGAVAIASAGARSERQDSRFTELWVLPAARKAGPGGEAVSIGVVNHLGSAASFVLQMQHGALLTSQPLRLAAGERWRTQVSFSGISSADPLLVTLLDNGALYRRASLASGPKP
jgi:uncharacterized membrane protein